MIKFVYMITSLAEKDSLWRNLALRLCGDKNTADDVVNEMYLRRYDNDRGQETTDYYIFCTMKSIFLNMKKTNKLIAIGNDEVNVIVDRNVNGHKFEPDDKQQELLNKANQLPFTQRELLQLNYDSSLRDIQNEFGINYMFCHRAIKEAREYILGEDIGQYNNKRLKHRKIKQP